MTNVVDAMSLSQAEKIVDEWHRRFGESEHSGTTGWWDFLDKTLNSRRALMEEKKELARALELVWDAYADDWGFNQPPSSLVELVERTQCVRRRGDSSPATK